MYAPSKPYKRLEARRQHYTQQDHQERQETIFRILDGGRSYHESIQIQLRRTSITKKEGVYNVITNKEKRK